MRHAPSIFSALGAAGLLAGALAGCAPPADAVSGDVTLRKTSLEFGNVTLLRSPDGEMLVDLSVEGSLPGIEDFLAEDGLVLEDIDLVVLTHGHQDHAGAAAELLEAVPEMPVLAGEGDVEMLAAGEVPEVNPTGVEATLLSFVLNFSFPPVEPTRVLEGRDDLSLAPFGFPTAVVRPTGGHTAGSLAVLLPGVGVVGDLIRGGALGGSIAPNLPEVHYFHEDLDAAHHHLSDLLTDDEYRVRTVFPGHGGPLKAEEVLRVIEP